MTETPISSRNQEWERKLKGKKISDSAQSSGEVFSRSELPQRHRVISPGMKVTRDLVEDRLNVHVDEAGFCTHCTHG